MTDLVASNELLARYIVAKNWFHKKDQTVKQNAFIPDPYPELSVTRHLGFSEDEIWRIGQAVAAKRVRILYGRADVVNAHLIAQRLNVEPDPLPENPNHANIIDWPLDKDARKACALEIARVARFVSNPVVPQT